jgi:predicted phosphate transport protein (TIGR00153 family)
MFNVMPKDALFFDLFEKAAGNAHACTEALVVFLDEFDDLGERAHRVKDLEHIGDELTHETIELLNKSFITPIDREDIHELICRVDDILDLVDTAVDRIVLFKIEKPITPAKELALCLVRSTALIRDMMPMLRNMKHADVVRQKVREVHRLENEADRIERQALASLFEDGEDPKYIIKWMNIIEGLETATDRCEDVANVIEGIVLKNA